MLKRSKFETTQSQIMHRAEELINAASNRYRITVQVANRAKRRRYEDFDNADDIMMKPVLRAIIEMSDELTQPEIIGEV
jgi:DNA-directed RNA polymerase subunit omega